MEVVSHYNDWIPECFRRRGIEVHSLEDLLALGARNLKWLGSYWEGKRPEAARSLKLLTRAEVNHWKPLIFAKPEYKLGDLLMSFSCSCYETEGEIPDPRLAVGFRRATVAALYPLVETVRVEFSPIVSSHDYEIEDAEYAVDDICLMDYQDFEYFHKHPDFFRLYLRAQVDDEFAAKRARMMLARISEKYIG